MTLFCKYILCFRFARDGTRACRKHQCSVNSCRQPVHLHSQTCFDHFPQSAQSFFSQNNTMGDEIVFDFGESPQPALKGAKIHMVESNSFDNKMFSNF